MTDAIILHKRKPYTPLQRAKMFDEHKGICCICGCKIQVGQKWIDEHERALALGGTNDPDNRGPAHAKCAQVKTKDDMKRTNKAKNTRAKHVGATRPKRKIPSRPFGTRRGMLREITQALTYRERDAE